MGYIYKITNLINNKLYIGKTEKTIEYRWKCHIKNAQIHTNRYLYDAMNHYGYDNFKIEIIEECDNSLLNDREIYWINYYNSFNEGYNMTLGGDGGNTWERNNHKEETSQKLKISLTGSKRTEEQRKHMSKAQIGTHVIEVDKEQLLLDIQTCNSIKEVYTKHGISYRTFYNKCHQLFNATPTELRGDRFTHTNTNKRNIDKNELLHKIYEGYSLKELALYFNVSKGTICRRLEEYFSKTFRDIKKEVKNAESYN